MQRPEFDHKVSSAIKVLIYGVSNVGESCKAELMWPYRNMLDKQVQSEAVSFLSSVLTAALQESHPARIEMILKDQDERLSSALEIAQQNAKTPCRGG